VDYDEGAGPRADPHLMIVAAPFMKRALHQSALTKRKKAWGNFEADLWNFDVWNELVLTEWRSRELQSTRAGKDARDGAPKSQSFPDNKARRSPQDASLKRCCGVELVAPQSKSALTLRPVHTEWSRVRETKTRWPLKKSTSGLIRP
jgi:hypothetical protein